MADTTPEDPIEGTTVDSVDEAGATAEASAEEPLDDKARFRAALARKSGGAGHGGSGGPGGGKIGEAHGQAKATRTFRRKSGG